jgi:hypothetical protein
MVFLGNGIVNEFCRMSFVAMSISVLRLDCPGLGVCLNLFCCPTTLDAVWHSLTPDSFGQFVADDHTRDRIRLDDSTMYSIDANLCFWYVSR